MAGPLCYQGIGGETKPNEFQHTAVIVCLIAIAANEQSQR